MRRICETVVAAFSWTASLGLLLIVAFLLFFLARRGIGTIEPALFFGETHWFDALLGGQQVFNGIWPAVVGTFFLIALASAFAIPLGISAGIYLAEYATGGWKRYLSFGIDLLAGIPSILMGLFGFAMILLLRKTIFPQANVCLLLSAGCLAILALPYLVRTTRTALEALPEDLRLAGLSVGYSRRQNLFHLLLPAASRGIFSGIVMAVGRVAEDTAVILMTGVVADAGVPHKLTDKFEALPFNIYYLAAEYRTAADLNRGFGSALVLLCITGTLFYLAYCLIRIMEKRWKYLR